MRKSLLILIFCISIECPDTFAEGDTTVVDDLAPPELTEFPALPTIGAPDQDQTVSLVAPDSMGGEILLFMRDDITEVYSNGNLIENIVQGIGSTGIIGAVESESVRFTPTGRPELTCPQKGDGWFGPCRIA